MHAIVSPKKSVDGHCEGNKNVEDLVLTSQDKVGQEEHFFSVNIFLDTLIVGHVWFLFQI